MIEKLLTFFIEILEKWQSRESVRALGARRSACWRKARREHIKKFPACAITGDTKNVQVHHIRPVHKYPQDECKPINFITLRRDMHFIFAHLRSYHSFNINIREDAEWMRNKILNRP